MVNVHTLQDINMGHRLGSLREQELSDDLKYVLQSKAEISDLSERLQSKYEKREKDFKEERKQWDQEKKQLSKESTQNKENIEFL